MNDMKSFINKLKNRFELVLFRARGALAHVQGRPLHTLWRHRVAVAILLVVGVFGVELGLLKLPKANAAYTISNSARFVSGNSAYLSKTPAGAGNQQKWTYSTWVKRSGVSSDHAFFSARTDDNNRVTIRLDTTNAFVFKNISGGATTVNLASNALFRDPSAWMHFVVEVDTTQPTAADRIKVFVNGVQLTSFSLGTYPSLNENLKINDVSAHTIGRTQYSTPDGYFDGYMADTYFIDGAALAPTCFGATDANGYWRPTPYSTGSPCAAYGTNGFHLAFGNGAALGTDSSGNSNTFTVNGLTSTDQVIDTPTNSFTTLNPLSGDSSYHTNSYGNLRDTSTNSISVEEAQGTMAVNSGKWYWEDTAVTNGGSVSWLGISPDNGIWRTASNAVLYGYFYESNGNKYIANSGTAYGATYTAGDVIGIALDFTNNQITFYKNNVSQGAISITPGSYFPSNGVFHSWVVDANFGQGGQSGLTYDSASGGYFKYTPPSGFKALSTANLPAPTITVPKNYFDAVTYTGTGVASSYGSNLAYFTSTGTTTWTVPQGVTSVSVLAVAGGGGGGGGNTASTVGNGGGGGGGGVVYNSSYSVTPGQIITVAVGAGGSAGGAGGGDGTNGVSSAFGTMVANGGGFGGTYNATSVSGGSGGSGGGGQNNGGTAAGGSATQGNSGGGTGYGNAGGASSAVTAWGSGGGGGAGAVGAVGTGAGGGAGGIGKLASTFDARFPAKYYGGGGGGGAYSAGGGAGGAGGNGGGGAGAASGTGTAGSANTGGGGGGGGNSGGQASAGGVGGSGIVIVSYTANSSTIGFTPDLVWIKDRTTALMHNIFDSVRSVIPYWSSNSSAAETVASNALTAFLSNGFSLGTNALFNTSGNNYVAWMWKKAPTTDGVDMVTYTGDGTSNRNISHSLGAAPDMVIVKRRDAAGSSYVWTSGLTGATYFTTLDRGVGDAQTNTNTPWGTGNFSSSQFMVTNNGTNNLNASGATYVAYLFKNTSGFSQVGTYTGNASADGPFVYTGFKPKYVMVHNVSAGGNWYIYDGARGTYNAVQPKVYADSTAVEDTGNAGVDFLSNGFKLRNTDSSNNGSGNTLVYAAFADIPFQQSAQPYNLTIASSTRFISGNSDNLTRTFGSGNTQKWTWSGWVKRSKLGTAQGLFTDGATSCTTNLEFNSSDQIFSNIADGTCGANPGIVSNAVFRDPAQWLHVVWAVDTTQATAANRNRIYINGTEITSFSSASYPTQNYNSRLNTAVQHFLGDNTNSTHFYYDGYMSDVYFVDGQALTPSSFAEYDTNGVWRPKTYSGTYGTNGFHLPLTTTSPGTDTSGNSNTFTASGLLSTDNVKDSPTNNFATLSPIDNNSNLTLSAGNLTIIPSSTADYWRNRTGFGMTSGKWYWEVKLNTTPYLYEIGISSNLSPLLGDKSTTGKENFVQIGTCTTCGNPIQYESNGGAWTTWTSSGTGVSGDVFMVAYDADNGTMWIGRNGTWINSSGSANPATATDPRFTGITGTMFPTLVLPNPASGGVTANFGQGGQSSLTYDSTAGGYFKYTPPSGFKALSTANLPTPTITKPFNYFNAYTYAGTGAALSVSGGRYLPTGSTSCGAGTYTSGQCLVYLTSGTSWTVPSDWNSETNSIEVIGGGGGGGQGTLRSFSGQNGHGGPGGGGGGYSKSPNVSLTPGGSVAYAVGTGGSSNAGNGGDTYICNSASGCGSISGTAVVVGAKGGAGGTNSTAGPSSDGTDGTAGAGGAAASGVGTVKYSGGTGGTASDAGARPGNVTGYAGAGGGGAAGLNGAGSNGVDAPVDGTYLSKAGGAADNNTVSGGAGGTQSVLAGAGSSGVEWDSSHGSGAGGGSGIGSQTSGAAVGANGGAGGSYGGGGGGGGGSNPSNQGQGNGGAGQQGIIVIKYTPATFSSFTPDLVWIKDRTTTNAHGIFDSARTVIPAWASNANNAEGGAGGTSLTGFLSNGFSLGASSAVNTLGDNFVAWLWKRCPTALFTLSCTAANGVDIVTYTGDNTSNRTISHSLGAAPEFAIIKRRDSTGDPFVWHTSLTGAAYFLLMDSTAAQTNTNTPWGTGGWTSSTFMVTNNATNNANASGATYVAYLFKGIDGFSKFGTYTGNASTDGPFIYTGFKPRYVMIRKVSTGDDWWIFDTARTSYNVIANDGPYADAANAETANSGTYIDILSNGFKLRNSANGINSSGATITYAAFADQPFYYSAQPAASTQVFSNAASFLMGMTY